MSELARFVPPQLDMMLPIEERVDLFMDLCQHTAEAIVSREEDEDTPWMPQEDDTPEDMQRRTLLRKQEVARRTLKTITEVEEVANRAVLKWALENGEQTWIGPSGEQTSLREVLEHLMPNEEARASSGRARQISAFAENTVPVFRAHGIGDEEILRCQSQSKKSYLGYISAAQSRVSATDEDIDSRTEKFHKMISVAESAPNAYALRRDLASIIGDDEGPPVVPFTIESDDDNMWLIICLPGDATYLVMDRLRDVIEPSVESLAERFCQFWRRR